MRAPFKSWLLLLPLAPWWRMAVFALGGAACDGAVVVAHISRAESYLSDKPEACLNCHVMNNAFATWQHGSHRGAAECADCHLPHQNFVAETAFKIRDGLRHSYVFTFHLEPQVLELSDAAKHVVQGNCLRCHANQFMMARLAGTTERHCWDCHHGVHGREISLSGTPHAFRAPLPAAGLEWMRNLPLQTQEKESSHEQP